VTSVFYVVYLNVLILETGNELCVRFWWRLIWYIY